MADKRTTEETLASAIADADQFRAVQGGLNVRMTFGQVKTWAQGFLAGLSSGNAFTGAQSIAVSSVTAFAVGLSLANPAFVIDTTTPSSVTGIKIKSAAAGAGIAVSAISSGTNENLTIDAKGNGTISLGLTSTGNIVLGRDVAITPGNLTVAGNFGGGGDVLVTKAVGILSEQLTATLAKVNVTYIGSGGVAWFLKDSAAGADLKYFNIDVSAGIFGIKSLTDVGAIKNTFMTFDSSTGNIGIPTARIDVTGPFVGTNSVNATYAAIGFNNFNAGAAAAVADTFASTNAGSFALTASSTAGGGLALLRWTGAGGLFIDQNNAAGSIFLRTGAGPTAGFELTVAQNAIFSGSGVQINVPNATFGSLTFNDTSVGGRAWVWGPRTGTGSADFFSVNGGTFGTIFLFNGVSGASIANGALVSQSATGGVGYTTGAGGTVTQATSKSTGVTLNKVTGTITMNGAALAAGAIVSFTLTNSAIGASDQILVSHEGTGTLGGYGVNGRTSGGAGSGLIDVRNNTAGSLSEAITLRFSVLKSINA